MLKPGDRFGDYRVRELLGRGGMGEVWRMELESSGRSFAVKILDPELVAKDREFRKRFACEAEIAMVVRHPNLVRVYDVGEDPDSGLCYLIMDYMGGGSLADRLSKRGKYAVEEAMDIVVQLADVLELARIDGVVHRDIKPDNVMFTSDGVPKLTDLGIARRRSVPADLNVTMPGFMIGTPEYMAPEQMIDSHGVDSRADIYSLGILFHELLTGRCPNAGLTAVQVLRRATKGEGIADVRTVEPNVPVFVARLISKMCETDVEKRIATPGEVAQAIRAIKEGRDPFAPPKTRDVRMRRRRRLWWIIAAGTLLAFALLAADVTVYWLFLRKPDAEEEVDGDDFADDFYVPDAAMTSVR